MMHIAENLRAIRARMEAAALAAGRPPEDVLLVAVSKTKPNEDVMAAYEAGQRDFGENYPQELRDKQPLLPADIRWHFIGHLQTNKVKYLAGFVHLIHSIDSEKLLAEVQKQAAKNGRVIDCLLQIHISGEETKQGMTPEEAAAIVAVHTGSENPYPHIRLRGVMGMAALTDDMALVAAQFRGLSQLGMRLFGTSALISMGMTDDMNEAIAEGATLIRVGSAIFGKRG